MPTISELSGVSLSSLQSVDGIDIANIASIDGVDAVSAALLLDTYTGADVAYSLRLLRTAYKGSAIQVQRADNVGGTTDIGFDSSGELDTAALTTAASGNDMAVATWYDQSVNGNDVVQTSSLLRPKIYDGTTGVVTRGTEGKPSVLFTGSTQILPLSTSFNLNTYLYVGQPLDRCQAFGTQSNRSVRTNGIIGYRNASFEWASGSLYVLHNGTVYDATGGTNPISVNLGFDIVLFKRGSLGTRQPGQIGRENTQYISELIAYSTLESNSNLVGISNNANTFYDVY